MAGFEPHKDPCGKLYHNGRMFDLCGKHRAHADEIHEGFGNGIQWRIDQDGKRVLISRGDNGTPGGIQEPQEYRGARTKTYGQPMLPEPETGFAGAA